MKLMNTALALADATPAERNRVVDFLRAAAILVVVVGHWLMAAVYVDDAGVLHRGDLIETVGWSHPLTWVFQVMPIFFLVGGYSNALSWQAAQRDGHGYGTWLRARLRRLTLPVLPLLLFWTFLVSATAAFGMSVELLQLATQAALVPTWFLATYVVVVAIAPLTMLLWQRIGWWSIGAGLALGGVVDVVSVTQGLDWLGFLNYLLVWGCAHQLGYAWLDGELAAAWRRVLLIGAGFVALYLLTVHGPYATSMVSFNTDEIDNAVPTRVTHGLLALLQVGIVLSLEPAMRRLLAHRKVWAVTVLVNARIMSIYLWHLTLLVVLALGSLAVGGFGFRSEPHSTLWWATRPVYFTALALLTVAAVALVGRFETPRPDPRPGVSAILPLLAVIATCAALGVMATGGVAVPEPDGSGSVRWWLPLVPIAASFLFGVSRWPRRSDEERPEPVTASRS